MAIIKTKKRENPFVQIDKTGIEDSRLSWKATGLLTYLIGRPEDWNINLTHLSKQKKDKLDSTKSALKELREFDYCHYFEIRKYGKIVETFYMVYEIPTAYDENLKMELLKNIEEDYPNCSLLYKKVTKKRTVPKKENEEIIKETKEKEKKINVESIAIKESTPTKQVSTKQVYTYKKKKNLDSDVFENIFQEFGINYTRKNQESVKRLLKKQKESEVIFYLKELYKNLSNSPNIKNLAAIFSSKLEKQECQIIPGQSFVPVEYEKQKKEEIEERESGKDLIQELFQITKPKIDKTDEVEEEIEEIDKTDEVEEEIEEIDKTDEVEEEIEELKLYNNETELEEAWLNKISTMPEIMNIKNNDIKRITLKMMKKTWEKTNKIIDNNFKHA